MDFYIIDRDEFSSNYDYVISDVIISDMIKLLSNWSLSVEYRKGSPRYGRGYSIDVSDWVDGIRDVIVLKFDKVIEYDSGGRISEVKVDIRGGGDEWLYVDICNYDSYGMFISRYYGKCDRYYGVRELFRNMEII